MKRARARVSAPCALRLHVATDRARALDLGDAPVRKAPVTSVAACSQSGPPFNTSLL